MELFLSSKMFDISLICILNQNFSQKRFVFLRHLPDTNLVSQDFRSLSESFSYDRTDILINIIQFLMIKITIKILARKTRDKIYLVRTYLK